MKTIYAVIIVLILNFSTVYAMPGDNGFEGGISSGGTLTQSNIQTRTSQKQTYLYKEMVLITGIPLVFEGTVTVSKSIKGELETYTYNYTLANGEKNTLTRQCVYESINTTNGVQTIRVIGIKQGSKPRETVVIDGMTYTLTAVNNQNFSMSTITDGRPACDYYAGDWSSEKIYKTETGKKVTIAMASRMYGYNQYWGAAETQEIGVCISSETVKNNISYIWGGEGTIKIISSTLNKLFYMENKPDAISFEGGYIKKQENKSTLTYNFNLPLYISDMFASRHIKNYNGTIELSTFPQQERLAIPDTSAVRGHRYEEIVRLLSSLDILDSNYVSSYADFGKFITRKEFAKAAAEAAKLSIMEVPNENSKISRKSRQETVEKLPFYDVNPNDEYYKYIFTLYKEGVMLGTSENCFSPDASLSRVQAIVILVRMLGLESMVTASHPVKAFNDKDLIPDWARDAVVAAAKIGIAKGDAYNNLKPNENLSKAEGAILIKNLINYMMEGMVKDYENYTASS